MWSVGVADQNALFTVFIGRSKRVFRDYRLFGGIEYSAKRLLFEIWRFLCLSYTNNDDDNDNESYNSRTDYSINFNALFGMAYTKSKAQNTRKTNHRRPAQSC